MSTALEAEEAQACGLACSAISCITNKAAGLGEGLINHEEVVERGATFVELVGRLLAGLLDRCEDCQE
jgi:purine-nucleoside phosphorylase